MRSLGFTLCLALLPLAAPATAHSSDRTCLGEFATIVGTNGKDVLRGTSGSDVIVGLKGLDTLRGLGGNDVLCPGPGGFVFGHGSVREEIAKGGAGSDRLKAGRGFDVLIGGAGKDVLVGRFRYDEEGGDRLSGGRGADLLKVKVSGFGDGGPGDDRLLLQGGTGEGGRGNDDILGSGRAETMSGDGGADVIHGSGGRDGVFGYSGNDRIYGSTGSDRLSGGSGNDRIHGGRGRDHLAGDGGDNLVRGGKGTDRANAACCRPAFIDLARGILIQGEGRSRLQGIEESAGSNRSDTLIGSASSNQLVGEAGSDVIRGRGGDDVLAGSWGSDRVVGGDGNDRLSGGSRNSAIGTDDDFLEGRAGDDQLSGGWGSDSLRGDRGDDRLDAGRHSDALDGGDGDDNLLGKSGGDELDGGDGTNTSDGGSGVTDGCIRPGPSEGALNCEFALTDIEPHSGMWLLYSQRADVAYKRLIKTIDISSVDASDNPTLTFWSHFETEPQWDFMFVEAHEPGQTSWTTLPDESGLTTQETGRSCSSGWTKPREEGGVHPWLQHYQTLNPDDTCLPSGDTGEWHAATGFSQGWRQWSVDLSGYAGGEVEISISFATDWRIQRRGIWLDDLAVTTDAGELESTGFETDFGGWEVVQAPEGSGDNSNNWTRTSPSQP